jgi:glycosyltransferase involved in cell wall biosynthesis
MARLAIVFHRLSHRNYARIAAAAAHGVVTAIELCPIEAECAGQTPPKLPYRRITLFESHQAHARAASALTERMNAALSEVAPFAVAVGGWSDPGALAALAWCVKHAVPAVVMSDTHAGEAPRAWWREWAKRRVIALFSAGLVGGTPQLEYLAALGMPRERIFTGYNVVDNAHFAAGADAARRDDAATRRRLDLPPAYLLACVRFAPEKNLLFLLGAFAEYRRRAPAGEAWGLVLAGDGEQWPLLERRIAELSLQGVVHTPGFVEYDDLPAYYGLAGAFVLASLAEPWGIVINEAMATGLPVLVSDRSGCVPDLVADGKNGCIFDPCNAHALAERVVKLCHGGYDRAAMGDASREIIARWTLETFAQNLWRAVETAAQAPRPRPGTLDKLLLDGLVRR